jgi:hypothetical protein
VCDVDAEPAHTSVEPEAKDAVELVADVRVPPVEVGLLRRELMKVVALPRRVVVPRGPSGEDGRPVVRDVIRPDVVLRAVGEPRVLVGGVVRDEVEPDVDVVLARLRDQRVVVGERAVVGVDPEVVGDVVAPVDVRARVDGREPKCVNAERCELVEPRTNAAERADVDLVERQLIVQASPESTSACRSPSPLAF